MHASPYGWDYLQNCIEAYKRGLCDGTPIEETSVNNSVSQCVVGVHCAATREKTLDESRPATLGFAKFLMPFYHVIGETSSDHAYEADVKNTLDDHADDLPYLVDALPWFLIGTPDDFIDRLNVFTKMSIDEVILRMDGYGHKTIMEGIETIREISDPRILPTSPVIVPMKGLVSRRIRICCDARQQTFRA